LSCSESFSFAEKELHKVGAMSPHCTKAQSRNMVSFLSHSRQACLLLTWLLDWFWGHWNLQSCFIKTGKYTIEDKSYTGEKSACMNTLRNFQTELIHSYFWFGNLTLSMQSQYRWMNARGLAAWTAPEPLCRAINSRWRSSLFCCLLFYVVFFFLCLWTAGCFDWGVVVLYACKVPDTFPNDTYYYGYYYYSSPLPLFSNASVCRCGQVLLAKSILYTRTSLLEANVW